jgi:hypothetical protein
MGEARHGQQFARELDLDLESTPLLVDAGPRFALYQELGLKNEDSLVQLYLNTFALETVSSAFRTLREGNLPTYDAGGSLTQLGGTFIIAPPPTRSLAIPQIIYEKVDTHTGVHAPVAEVVAALVSFGEMHSSSTFTRLDAATFAGSRSWVTSDSA